MRNLLNKIAYKSYISIFKEEPTESIIIFAKNLWYVAVGFGAYTVLGFFSQIITGRFLGPAGYGKYTLVQSVASFLFIPMSFCISTALIKYNAEKEDGERRRKIISTAYLMVFIFSAVSMVFFFFFSNGFSKILGVSLDIFTFSIIFALFYNLYVLSVDTLRSLHDMRRLSILQAIYGLLFLAIILSLVFAHHLSFKTVVFTEYITYLVVFLSTVFLTRKYISFGVDKFWALKILRYSSYAITAAVASAFYLNFNRIVINMDLSSAKVGIFGAYFACFVTLPTMLFSMFNTVFFPSVSKIPDKKRVFFKLNKVILLYTALGFPCVTVAGFIFLKFYGAKYNFNLGFGLALAFSSLLVFIDGVYGWLMNSAGERGVKINSLAAVALAIVNVVLNIVLVPKMGLYGVIVAMAVSYLISICILLANIKSIETVQ